MLLAKSKYMGLLYTKNGFSPSNLQKKPEMPEEDTAFLARYRHEG
jgi:hypothetical protein